MFGAQRAEARAGCVEELSAESRDATGRRTLPPLEVEHDALVSTLGLAHRCDYKHSLTRAQRHRQRRKTRIFAAGIRASRWPPPPPGLHFLPVPLHPGPTLPAALLAEDFFHAAPLPQAAAQPQAQENALSHAFPLRAAEQLGDDDLMPVLILQPDRPCPQPEFPDLGAPISSGGHAPAHGTVTRCSLHVSRNCLQRKAWPTRRRVRQPVHPSPLLSELSQQDGASTLGLSQQICGIIAEAENHVNCILKGFQHMQDADKDSDAGRLVEVLESVLAEVQQLKEIIKEAGKWNPACFSAARKRKNKDVRCSRTLLAEAAKARSAFCYIHQGAVWANEGALDDTWIICQNVMDEVSTLLKKKIEKSI